MSNWELEANDLNDEEADGVENEAKRRSLLFRVRLCRPRRSLCLTVRIQLHSDPEQRRYDCRVRAARAGKAFGFDEQRAAASDHVRARSMTPKTHEADPPTVRPADAVYE